MNKSRYFYAKIYGAKALITAPESKSGGEKISYDIPTGEVLKGIIDANYFKPTILNVIDEVRIMNKIESYTQGIRLLLKDYKSDLSAYTFLTDVCYYVKFHFEWNEYREDLKNDRNFNKHESITERSLRRGGRRPIFLGVSECMGYIDILTEEEYENDIGYYDDTSKGFGLMFVGFIYPKESGGILKSAYAPINMKNGRIVYPKPEECPIINEVSNYSFKEPSLTKTVDEELKDY
ncbi:type I-C CRISPR-associated protein Cas5c [Peptoniphilus rhinitidis]|uniref:type I-C CRISPR-associated protein Cas5c n=1 Tax=Peptoniphilus rhinitidis TaxID=1175452 RepID=UPI002354D617|nr:type I-C CRISPR-associated protein Cas5c [Peptoniphilus rhinitidis]